MMLYQLYQAERAKTDAELREAAAVQAQIAAAMSRLCAGITRPARAVGFLFTNKGARAARRPAPVAGRSAI